MKKQTLEVESEDFAQTFKSNEAFYERLVEEAHFTLKEELDKTEIKIHSIPSRIKKIDSFLNKISLYKIKKPFEEINDIIGLRVICLFLTDIEKIGNVIRETFHVIKEDNKIDNSKFASFGYLSVHFIVRLGDNFKGTRYNNICEIPFEIQVRTIAMDAWANISHYLDYKTDKDIPEELKRDFYALSGMFYVADKHFQLFFEQRKENTEEITEVFEKGKIEDINSQPINLDTIKAFLRDKLPDNLESQNLSPLVEDLSASGLKTIGELNLLIEKNKTKAIKYAEKYLETPNSEIKDSVICFVSVAIDNFDFFICFRRRSEKDYQPNVDEWKSYFDI